MASPPPERPPPPPLPRFRLRPPPERAGAWAGAAAPAGDGRESPIAGRVSPILGRSTGATGAETEPVSAPTATASALVTAGDGVTGAEVAVGRGVARGLLDGGCASVSASVGSDPSDASASSVSSPSSASEEPPALFAPVRLLPRPPRDPRRRRLALLVPLEDSPSAPSEASPGPSEVPASESEPDELRSDRLEDVPDWESLLSAALVTLGASGTRAGAAAVCSAFWGVGDEGGACASGVCPMGESDIEFPSETVHDARSMACMARSAPAGATRPRSGS